MISTLLLFNLNWPNIFGIIWCLHTAHMWHFFFSAFDVMRINAIENALHYYYFDTSVARDAQLAFEYRRFFLCTLYTLSFFFRYSYEPWVMSIGPCIRPIVQQQRKNESGQHQILGIANVRVRTCICTRMRSNAFN